MKDTNTILTNNLSIFNNNINISNEENLNGLHFDNINENINFNSINSDKNDFLQNKQENDYLKFKLNCNYINDIDCNSINYSKVNNNAYNIVELLKNNPDINSYKDIVDYLTFDDLLKMFSFILNNIMIFISNSQSFLIINKIISLYNSSNHSINEMKKNIETNLSENIFNFLTAFFSKRIIYLINSNNYITTILNLVPALGFPKNDFIFTEVRQDFKNFSKNRQGCILIQNLFPLGNVIQQQNLLGAIFSQYNELIVDRYGHYIFKYLLYKVDHGEKYYLLIFNKIVNNLKKYTTNKYSSVVIERLLDSSNEDIKGKIIERICGNEKDVVELLYHPFGNYVLQKIINISKDKYILGMIYKTIMKNKNSLYKLSYGKKIMKEISVAYTLK